MPGTAARAADGAATVAKLAGAGATEAAWLGANVKAASGAAMVSIPAANPATHDLPEGWRAGLRSSTRVMRGRASSFRRNSWNPPALKPG